MGRPSLLFNSSSVRSLVFPSPFPQLPRMPPQQIWTSPQHLNTTMNICFSAAMQWPSGMYSASVLLLLLSTRLFHCLSFNVVLFHQICALTTHSKQHKNRGISIQNAKAQECSHLFLSYGQNDKICAGSADRKKDLMFDPPMQMQRLYPDPFKKMP